MISALIVRKWTFGAAATSEGGPGSAGSGSMSGRSSGGSCGGSLTGSVYGRGSCCGSLPGSTGLGVRGVRGSFVKAAPLHLPGNADYVFCCGIKDTSTDMSIRALFDPTKPPATGTARLISRTTATGIRLKPPIVPFVGSNAIQPAPGT